MWRLVVISAVLAACGSDPALPDGGDSDTDAAICGIGSAGEPGVVVTTSGAIRGVAAAAGGTAYLGVPYAAPPVGDLRWRPPAPAACEDGVRDADAYGPRCPQADAGGGAATDEACLTLNVWVPDGAATDRPVMVFVHGGGNSAGSASDPLYAGDRLAAAGDVVVVTIEYRLGQLGYLAHPALSAENVDGVSGNYGLLDQVAALGWVRDNIAAFSGDPDNVTIFGESAGGRNVCTLLATPAAAGLFARAIVESGACKFLRDLPAAEAQGQDVVDALGCAGAGDVAACLRAASAADVVAAVPSDVGVLTSSLYNPVVDGVVLPAQPEAALRAGDAAAVPLIVGANADETGKEAPLTLTQTAYEDLVHAQFGPALGDQILAEYAAVSPPRAAYVALTSDARFICPSREIARSATTGAGTARRYLFRYAPGAVGAVHGLELPYVFGTFDAVVVPGGGTYTPTATDLALSARLQRMWTRFARTGDPGADPDPAWPAWDDGDPVMVLDDPTAVEAGAGAAHCDFWRPLYEAL